MDSDSGSELPIDSYSGSELLIDSDSGSDSDSDSGFDDTLPSPDHSTKRQS